jgi:diguanylate cyclase (GGDEF)-like protein/PAS domain S-box-containing protein
VLSISPILRLSIGLILLTVSLLLVGDMLGLAPDPKRAELSARKAIAEALAVQVSQGVGRADFDSVRQMIGALQERNESVLSAGLRASDNRLLAVAGDHTTHWENPGADTSTAAHVQVPIHSDEGRWGVLEVSFEPLDSLTHTLFRGGSIATVIIFVAVFGFVGYSLFLKRALKELDPSSVVPDRVRAALDVLAEGLVLLDRRGRIVLANDAFQAKLGQPASALIGNELASLNWQQAQGGKREDDAQFPWQRLLSEGKGPESAQLRLQKALNDELVFGVNVSPINAPNGEIRGVVVTFDDLTELERKNGDLERALDRLEQSQREITRQNRELQVLATRDPLTDCLNRRSLFEGMDTLLRQAADEGEPLSCIMVDIDHFKSVNDRFGHATGDKVIKLIARILSDISRAEDLVGRYGGEEFCVVLPGVDEADAAEIAERMRVVVHEGKTARFTTALRISASFGVASAPLGRQTPGALVGLADQALYQAKQSGRNRVVRRSQVEGEPEANTKRASKSAADKAPSPSNVDRAALAEHTESLRARIVELEKLLLQQGGELTTDGDYADDTPSRVVVLDRIKQALQRGLRNGTGLAVFAVDIETVRLIRNTLGAAAAEKLQSMIIQRLKQMLRSTDTVSAQGADHLGLSLSRTGSGEFVILLADMREPTSTTWVAPRIVGALEGTVALDGNEVSLDARIGVSLYPQDGDDPDNLLANAAAAAHEAKATGGRNVCLYFNEEINLRAKEQLYIESQLHRAIGRNELYLEYQPSVDLLNGTIASFEALIRWKHPEMGMVRPDQFISVAEHAGLIEEIGHWVLHTAMKQLKSWRDAGYDDLNVAVNFSAVQFRDPALAGRIIGIMEEAGLPPSALVTEITETALIENLETAVSIVSELTAAGVRVALDDFGTGYSSLGYLKRFAIDVVKIDRSFLIDFPSHPHDTEIVSAIIAMAHSLGLRVVAEGVEDDRQLSVLRNLDCDEIQGFLLSRAVSRNEATELLTNPSRVRRILWANENAEDGAESPASAIAGVLNDRARRGISSM